MANRVEINWEEYIRLRVEEGFTDTQIAKKMNVARCTFTFKKKAYGFDKLKKKEEEYKRCLKLK